MLFPPPISNPCFLRLQEENVALPGKQHVLPGTELGESRVLSPFSGGSGVQSPGPEAAGAAHSARSWLPPALGCSR